jgi:hypothetical protein
MSEIPTKRPFVIPSVEAAGWLAHGNVTDETAQEFARGLGRLHGIYDTPLDRRPQYSVAITLLRKSLSGGFTAEVATGLEPMSIRQRVLTHYDPEIDTLHAVVLLGYEPVSGFYETMVDVDYSLKENHVIIGCPDSGRFPEGADMLLKYVASGLMFGPEGAVGDRI